MRMFNFVTKRLKSQNKADVIIPAVYIIIFASCVLLGCAVSNATQTSRINEIYKNLEDFKQYIVSNNVEYLKIFNTTMFSVIKYFSLIFLAGFFFFGPLICVLAIGYKGFAIGFASGCIIRIYGLNGMALMLYQIVLPNIFTVLIYIILAINSTRLSIIFANRIINKQSRKSYPKNEKVNYIVVSIILLFLITLSVFVISYIMPLISSVVISN